MKSPPAKLFFSFVTGSIPIYSGYCPGLVPNSPSSYSSSLSFSPCPQITRCIPPPLKYVLLLWNMYCRSEIYISTLKYVLLHQNIYFHSVIYYPDGMHAFANYHYAVQYGHRPTNGSITASYRPHVLLPSSYRVLTMCHRLYPPGEKFWACSKTFAGSHRPLTGHQRVHRSLNAPPCALAVCPHRVPSPCSTVSTKFTTRWHTVGLSRRHVTAT